MWRALALTLSQRHSEFGGVTGQEPRACPKNETATEQMKASNHLHSERQQISPKKFSPVELNKTCANSLNVVRVSESPRCQKCPRGYSNRPLSEWNIPKDKGQKVKMWFSEQHTLSSCLYVWISTRVRISTLQSKMFHIFFLEFSVFKHDENHILTFDSKHIFTETWSEFDFHSVVLLSRTYVFDNTCYCAKYFQLVIGSWTN